MKKRPSHTKKLLALFSVLILVGVKLLCGKSDQDIRDNVVMLRSSKGQCSGIQVKAPSGVSYILTAGHCRMVSEDGVSIPIITEGGKKLGRAILAEDPASDLLILEGLPGKEGLSIASRSSRFEEIRTFTHGRGHATYTTHGLIIDDMKVFSPVSLITSPEEAQKCIQQPKYTEISTWIGDLCVISVDETVMSAEIAPGSSGGAVVDPRGDLIGIASMAGNGFYYMVRLSDIQAFVGNY